MECFCLVGNEPCMLQPLSLYMDEQTIPERFPEDIQSVPMLLYFSNNAIAATGYRMFYDIDEKWGNNTTKFVNSYHAVVFIFSFSFKNPSIY